jgi:hypothetical protein
MDLLLDFVLGGALALDLVFFRENHNPNKCKI